MPMYLYRDTRSTIEVEIIRPLSQSDDPPTLEESGLSEDDYLLAKWEKIIQSVSVVKGAGWGGKGYW